MTRQDVTWVLELIKNRDARTDAECDAIDMAIEALREISILAKPKTGKWIVKQGNYCGVELKEYYCDKCGTRGALRRVFSDPEPLPNFCGHCGADMRGGEE